MGHAIIKTDGVKRRDGKPYVNRPAKRFIATLAMQVIFYKSWRYGGAMVADITWRD